MPLFIKVAARKSALSQAQIKEVEQELLSYSALSFEPVLVDSRGDLDLLTPLNELGQTDFFTQTIDQLIKAQKADIAIHSAKDLPLILDEELEIIALTAGVDPSDVLVSVKYTLQTLPHRAVIGVCSDRRIQAVKNLRADFVTKSIRGPIDHRLKQLENGDYDAIILAEAGLIRLKLDVPRGLLDHPTPALQGRLAIVALKSRSDLKELFKPLDARLCG